VYILLGLGNPGRKYELTRHNIGFLVLEYIAEKFNIPFSAGKGDYYFGQGNMDSHPVMLVKPMTYMNNSGLAVNQIREKYRADINKLLIIYDDFHLSFGTIRFRKKGSDAGHNGIRSIIYHLETDVFPRLKLGIGKEFDDPIDFVLSKFGTNERGELPKFFDCALKGIISWITLGIDSAMNDHNGNVLTMR
jgi:PTH1 family peptidyl-tRNA hydrolase